MATASPAPSIVSIEPAVARHIAVRTGNELADSSQARNLKSGSAEKRIVTDKRPDGRRSQDERRGANSAAGSREKVGRTRNNSLRHVKNSKELLRERSIKRNIVHSADALSTSKEGRNFTVGNVGTGGLIYLR
jgi:hypothetical protein